MQGVPSLQPGADAMQDQEQSLEAIMESSDEEGEEGEEGEESESVLDSSGEEEGEEESECAPESSAKRARQGNGCI